MIEKDMKKQMYSKVLDERLAINNSDDDSDEDITGQKRNNIGRYDEMKEEEEDKRVLEQISRMNLLEIIEQNEKKSEEKAREKHQNSFNLFSYDKNLYNIHKIDKKLIDYQKLNTISDFVFRPSIKEYDGLPYWIRQHKNLIFVGISQGIIRIFDVRTNEEIKPLFIKKNTINRVMSMDISLEGNYLVAGYSEGNIALFDVLKQKLITEIKDAHSHEIESIKFLSTEYPISFVSADKKGILYKASISKTLMIYTTRTELIMKKPFKEFCSFATLQPIKGMPAEVKDWQDHNIVAFANTEELNVAVLDSKARKIYSISRTEFAKGFVDTGFLWYLDWGYGITPVVSREKSKCLLAIAWGKVLQIMILEDPDQGMGGIKFDGYYICDYPIDWVYFISDSILMILVNKKEVRVLFIPYFPPGSFWYEGIKIKEVEDSKSTLPKMK